MNLESVIIEAIKLNASDLHLSSQAQPVARVAGDLVSMSGFPELSSEELIGEVSRAALGGIDDTIAAAVFAGKEVDCAFELAQLGRFRMNIYQHSGGVGVALRFIPLSVPAFDDLGLPESVRNLSGLKQGLVLVSGPTGSGKSTTLAALIELINNDQALHILTIEDPIEFIYTPKSALIRQREVGVHTESFAAALRAGLREDPDVILVGELRDLESIHLALTAAETGHLVFATLHASGAVRTLDRMIDVFPAQQQGQVRSMLADTLQAIVSQRLGKTPSGRLAPNVEIVTRTPAVSTLIREAKTHQLPGIIQASRGAGMCTFSDLFDRAS